jgi:GT2 family glycosyltransferase
MAMTSGALIVLYRPTEEHINNATRMRSLCGIVVAVDNTPQPDPALHRRLEADGIHVVMNANKGGIAGAFNRGMELLLRKQVDLLFTFDQDSMVSDDFFPKMIDAAKQISPAPFLIGPKIFDINVDRYIPLLTMRRWGVTLAPVSDTNCGLLPCSSMISSGSVMSASTFELLGPFREDYFIDQVDTEYCLRAHRAGVPMFINTALTMKHEIGKRIDRHFGAFKFIQWNYIPVRQYYSARNCLHLARQYGRKLPSVFFINLITLGQLISVLVYEDDKLRKIAAMVTGIVDGLLGRSGSMESRHLRIFNVCRPPHPIKQA